MIKVLFWTGIGLFAGSLMFSAWLGKIFAKKDVRDYGDGNPGAVNAWKAGGWKIGLPGALLDFLKGALPVSLAVWAFDVHGWALIPVAVAPIVGHAFSPFMGFKGGKAVAVTLGVWTGVTIWEGLGILGILMGLFFVLLENHSWAVMLAMLGFLVYLVITRGIEPFLWGLWAGNTLVLLYKHRHDLRESMKPRSYIMKLFRRTS